MRDEMYRFEGSVPDLGAGVTSFAVRMSDLQFCIPDRVGDILIDPPESEGLETVLLAEDDEAVRSVVQRALARRGYVVLAAPGGREALRVAQEHEGPIDLLLTDIMMPGMNGVVLAEAVERLRPDIKTFFMSGYADRDLVEDGLLNPDTQFIQKPFTPLELTTRIREILDE